MQRTSGLVWIILGLLLVSNSGCVGTWANLIQSWRGENVPPEYPGLKGKKVAILCLTERGINNDANSKLLSASLEMALGQGVKDITLISQNKIDQWLTNRNWTENDFEAIGKGVGAEQVVAVTLNNLTLRNGKTLYRGKADINIRVYDITQGGRVAFQKSMQEFTYPKLDATTTLDGSEEQFRDLYLTVVTRFISAMFCPHNPKDLYAIDPMAIRM